MHHREQVPSFRLREWPLGQASLPWLMLPKYSDINIGDLFEYLSQVIWTTPYAVNPVHFTLVNVFSPFTGYSHGYLPPAPSETWTPNSHLIFTFAISPETYYDYTASIPRQLIYSKHIWVKTWNSKISGRPMWLNIGINPILAERWKLKTLYANDLQYVYNMIGMMTKSLTRRHKYYQADGDAQTYDYSTTNLVEATTTSSIIDMSLHVEYKYWCFNKMMWKMAPNLFSTKMMTPELALWYVMNVNTKASMITQRVPGDRRLNALGLAGDDGVVQQISRSLLSFIQSVNAPGDQQLSALDLIAPALIGSLVYSGTPKVEASRDYVRELNESCASLIRAFSSSADKLGQLLVPPDSAALKLLVGDKSLTKKLFALIDLKDAQ